MLPPVPAKTIHPKSLSSVSRTRPSAMPICMTSSSDTPGQTSTIALTSYPAARNGRITAKSRLSSARNRIACFEMRRAGMPRAQIDHLKSIRFLIISNDCITITSPHFALNGFFRVLYLRVNICSVHSDICRRSAPAPSHSSSGLSHTGIKINSEQEQMNRKRIRDNGLS